MALAKYPVPSAALGGGDVIVAAPFYKSKRWLNKRARILRRDEYLCQECKRYGRSVPATTVHHIHPIEDRPDLALVSENLISLCSKCHDAMHNRNSDKLTEKGMKWAERVSPHLLKFN